MKYILMHKEVSVAEIEMDEELGMITSINNVLHKEFMPLGTVHALRHREVSDRAALHHWWIGRSIPASRMGIKEAFGRLGIRDSAQLITKSFGLSLSDHYWIKPEKSCVKWADINYFDNDFSDDVGNALFGEKIKTVDLNFSSPDNTSDGDLKKRWKIIEGKRCLIKSGSLPFYQQPFNEAAASLIAERLGIEYVPYTVIFSGNEPYSLCENFITKDTELISAHRVMQLRTKANHENFYLHYVNICRDIGVPDIVSELDKMIILDYIIANEDRHFNNFGLIRNADTLEWICAAPIYDSGNSLGYNRPAHHLDRPVECKPFKKHFNEQLRLVSSFDGIDLKKLDGIENEIYNIMMTGKEFITEQRAEMIAENIRRRIDNLNEFIMNFSQDNEPDMQITY